MAQMFNEKSVKNIICSKHAKQTDSEFTRNEIIWDC